MAEIIIVTTEIIIVTTEAIIIKMEFLILASPGIPHDTSAEKSRTERSSVHGNRFAIRGLNLSVRFRRCTKGMQYVSVGIRQ
jgi:hypothetical protein